MAGGSLAGWLRAVLAQRVVDRAREARRFEPLPETEGAAPAAPSGDMPDLDRSHHLPIVRAALAASLAALPPRDRLRLALYYTRQMKLAAVGRVLGESEATVSRKLDRTRLDVRRGVERRLREEYGLNDAQVAACYGTRARIPRSTWPGRCRRIWTGRPDPPAAVQEAARRPFCMMEAT